MKKLFLAIASLIISGCSDYEIEEYNMLCACGSVYAMSYPTTEDVEIITTLDHFDARPIAGGDWIDCSCSYTYVYVNVHENKSTDDREGLVEVYNDKYNLRDTIRVFQQGVYVPSEVAIVAVVAAEGVLVPMQPREDVLQKPRRAHDVRGLPQKGVSIAGSTRND